MLKISFPRFIPWKKINVKLRKKFHFCGRVRKTTREIFGNQLNQILIMENSGTPMEADRVLASIVKILNLIPILGADNVILAQVLIYFS